MPDADPRVALIEHRLDRLEQKLDDARGEIAGMRADIRELSVRHETAKGELRRIWALIAGVAAVAGGAVSQTISGLFQR